MNDKEEIDLIQSVKTTVVSSFIKWLVSIAGICITSLIIFYFQTTYVLGQNVKDTAANTVHVVDIKKSVDELKVIPKLNTQKIEGMEGDIDELKVDVKDIRKSQQKILELLYQIKQKQE